MSFGRRRTRHGEKGMTLIELMIALTMLVVGLIGVLALITTAISSNGRNKMDTASVLLAQMVTEKIAAQPANQGTAMSVQDCTPAAPHTWPIATATANPPGMGAGIDATTGGIRWTDPYAMIIPGYAMRYVTCGANGQQVTYEVRWNIQTVNQFTKMITVSARPLGMQTTTGTMLRFFALPVTLRTMVSTQ